ncbi:MAG TPA: primosomal protein N' [Candidatus Saccharimonadales bacterium]|nr:primosomal protein N' [Candidatus Saccharimonadales bacterium]
MYYYQVWVRSNRYHSAEPLTYSSEQKLEGGQIIQVELQRELVPAVVLGDTAEPRFKTKPIARVYDLPRLPSQLIRLCLWLQTYYPAPIGLLAQQLLPASFTEPQLARPLGVSFPVPDLSGLPPLTAEQSAALAAMEPRDSYVLHGVTGSGKTRLYIEMAAQAVSGGRSAIILTPEISLTAQLAERFRAVFGERVIVMHSAQTPTERSAAWLDALRAPEPVVVIGPRSALFSPVAKLGLIVLDEAHEAAYKQEQAPQYQTGRVAGYLASITPARLVLGSATPSISDYYLAEQKGRPIVKLEHLAQAEPSGATDVTLVDMKDRDQFSRSPLLSTPLVKAIEAALSRNEQSMLYLNRRGTARLVMCDNCGWQAACPHCDLPLTYHGDTHQLRCHSCQHHEPAPASCPVCKQPNILFRTAGTKAIVAEVERLFPQARVARFDTDNAKAERFEQHYDAVREGKVDILVGTQLLAKGLDLPRLSTLGIVLADTSLYMPDFSAEERTFQLITQVLGRINRGHLAGRAVIQSYHTDHPVLAAAIKSDYDGFYKTELEKRQQFKFPPFVYLLKLSVRRASLKGAETAANQLKEQLETSGLKVRAEGPAPSFYEKLQGKYQWQLVIKAVDRNELLKITKDLPSGWSYDLDPLDLL